MNDAEKKYACAIADEYVRRLRDCIPVPHVTSADTVQIFYCNNTAGAVDCDGASTTFKCVSLDW